MKRVLITGVNSYVGNRFAEWAKQYPEEFEVDKISVRDHKWKQADFSKYDAILHVAGIAHQRETKKNAPLYYQVNRDLAFEVARKAKEDGVKQFILLSSMSVYGLDSGVIDKGTPLNPKSHYGKSKKQAEEFINNLTSGSFKVSILRPPVIYGKGCKGNYRRLRELAIKCPFFPEYRNRRSMIYIDNFNEFLRGVIHYGVKGVFFPQNKDYVETYQMVKMIKNVNENKLIKVSFLSPLIKIMKVNQTVNKVFGSLVYEKSLSVNNEMQLKKFIEFEESIRLTEEQDEKDSNTL